MGHYTFTEVKVETAAVAWFAEMGYTVLHGPEIAPDGTTPERDSYELPLLTGRLQDAIACINPNLPREALDEAFKKLTRPASPPYRDQPHLPPAPHRRRHHRIPRP